MLMRCPKTLQQYHQLHFFLNLTTSQSLNIMYTRPKRIFPESPTVLQAVHRYLYNICFAVAVHGYCSSDLSFYQHPSIIREDSDRSLQQIKYQH